VGDAADTVDTQYYYRYASAGVSEYYLRNFPQFNRFCDGDQRRALLLRFAPGPLAAPIRAFPVQRFLHMEQVAGQRLLRAEQPGITLDSFNLALDQGLTDGQRRHVLTAALACSPLFRSDGWLANAPGSIRKMLQDWDLGALIVWESGPAFSVSSGKRTTGSSADSRANYSGKPDIGGVIRASNGIFWFSGDEFNAFSVPDPGGEGTSGRNMFHGPDYLDIDLALTRHIRLRESRAIAIRGEVYNLFNRANFALPSANLARPGEFGRITSTFGTPRILQIGNSFRVLISGPLVNRAERGRTSMLDLPSYVSLPAGQPGLCVSDARQPVTERPLAARTCCAAHAGNLRCMSNSMASREAVQPDSRPDLSSWQGSGSPRSSSLRDSATGRVHGRLGDVGTGQDHALLDPARAELDGRFEPRSSCTRS